ncbi:quercetin 2,3-dioxygenase [Paramyrothecium foliicola]|nr:quercetin 2,3-dioxygenase [Paramyrothecium foliicola]
MLKLLIGSLFLLVVSVVANVDISQSNSSLLVKEAPDHVRPYVLPKFAGHAVHLTASQIIRFSITANSSGGAFSLIQHTGKVSGWTSARPHTHRETHEHFYCSRGRVELWGQRNATNSSHEARIGTVGDYGNVPPGSIHTFQLVDPDTMLTHVFHPAGFEHLFEVFSGGNYQSSIGAAYPADPEDREPFGAVYPSMEAQLASLDLYVAHEEQFIPRRDFINGTAGDSTLNWHDGPNMLANDTKTPYFIAKDYGPKFLNTEAGYKVVQPLVTPVQTKDTGNFTMGTITLSLKLDNETSSRTNLAHPFALQMLEGQLALTVDGFQPTNLLEGDVAFIPANTSFTYHATIPFTKFLYMNGGGNGLDSQLLEHSIPWDFPTYPQFAGHL